MTTKLVVCSDLHLDYAGYKTAQELIAKIELAAKDADYVILAGDTTNCLDMNVDMLNSAFSEIASKVIMIHGNHDYWGTSFERVHSATKQLRFAHVLNNESVELNGLKIFGGTLWFDTKPIDLPKWKNWADFNYIENAIESITKSHKEFLKNIKKAKPDIVISHHLPSYKSVAKAFAAASTNIFFANKLDKLIKDLAPKLIVHGHTHNKFDYMIDSTRVVCNPNGYPGELSINWQPEIIEV